MGMGMVVMAVMTFPQLPVLYCKYPLDYYEDWIDPGKIIEPLQILQRFMNL